ncbi:MAG: hypothetical protein ACOCWO_03640 [Candidatus Muiribacteriaceae bacterium]
MIKKDKGSWKEYVEEFYSLDLSQYADKNRYSDQKISDILRERDCSDRSKQDFVKYHDYIKKYYKS